MTEKFIRDALILWTTIDPIGTLAIFTAITSKLDQKQRKRTAWKAILYSAAILLGAIVIGQVLLSAMGIRLLSLQVAGGVILFLFGLQMVFGSGVTSNQTTEEPGHDIAVFPLAVPSIATPGAILAVILLTDNHVYSIPTQATTAAILLCILAVTLICMLAATPILKVIGMNGASILVRVMGMILAALSTEFVMEALRIPQWMGAPP
ncbi:MAG: MarC family protein [Nitrospirales bacterium]|nr:MarC family protein [Nitrospirales bacterium]